MIDFNVETFAEFVKDAEFITQDHFDEVFPFKHIKFDLDHEYYQMAEDAGMLRVFTCRDAGKLIGYALFIVKQCSHAKGSIHAYQDAIYIEKSERGFGRNFIMWMDECLRVDGVELVLHYVKVAHDWSKALEVQGYVKTDVVYAKRLDAPN